jgi:formyl-CoA transferase
MVQDTEHDDGSVLPIPGPVAKFSRTPTRVRSAAARLGAHDDELLAELGLGSAEIASLRERGILVRNPDA